MRSGSPDLSKTWKIDKRKIQDMRREDLEVDRLTVDALVATGNTGGLVLYLALYVAKVCESSVWDMMELCPLIPESLVWVSIAGTDRLFGIGLGDVDQLQDQRSSSDDAATAGQKISTDDIFQD
jgi:hypothetical protein